MAQAIAVTSSRFATVTPDDHGGYIYIAALLSFVYSNLTFFARCFIKWKVFGLDDAVTCLGQVCSCTFMSLQSTIHQ
ncbi:hypothetical protein M011DRAFT_467377 [Sporormia fimetaria CBS 119925]|uniref:Uncharacterized protein n=1 Tax=Sporormia fimetaria CBS 119925 TaxID=1340428 RepID=A0A6A6VDI8_9PLEO|nr:hypothetical protein M011DRAFT_467377 [Sporormia fimetaria CBS 119925]